MFDYYPGVTLYAAASTKGTSSSTSSVQGSTKYSDLEILVPEAATLGLYLSPISQNPFSQKITKTSGTAFSDRGQAVDRYYLGKIDSKNFVPTLDTNTSGSISEIDDPVTLLYVRDGFGAKMIDRSGGSSSTSTSTTTSSPAAMPMATAASTSPEYGLAASAYLGIGADGGFLDKGASAGVFRIETLLTATWADRQSVLTLYPQTSPKMLSDNFFGVDSRISVSFNSNIKLALEYSIPLGSTKNFVGKAVLFGVTVSQ
jgi:hypothetical protein